MSIRYRITLTLIAIGSIPMLLMFGFFYLTINQMREQAFTGSNAALEEAGQKAIYEKASTVARELSIYLKAHPEIDPTDYAALEQNPEIKAIVVQPVGQTGYTASHDSKGISHFHNNPALVGTDLAKLAERLPDFWELTKKSFDGTVAQGYYDWLEPDGVTIRQKYMVIVPVEETDLRVGATTYIDEFSAPAKVLNSNLQTIATRSLSTIIFTILGVAGVAVAISIFLGRRFTDPIGKLTEVATQLQQGNLEAKAEVQSTDEIGKLAATFNSMSTQMRELIGSLEQRVADRTKDLAAVAEVGTATSTILDIGNLLQSVVELTKERFNLYHSHIYLLDESGENLVLAAGAGEAGKVMAAEKRSIPLDREQSLVARAARERKGVIVNDVTLEPDFLPNPLLPDTRAELAVPMVVGSNLLGVFDIQSDVVGRFTESDINVQTTLAAQVATSIQNVRSFEESKSRADLESMVNTIGQKIQRAATVEDALQTAIRELGVALGAARVSAKIGTNQASKN